MPALLLPTEAQYTQIAPCGTLGRDLAASGRPMASARWRRGRARTWPPSPLTCPLGWAQQNRAFRRAGGAAAACCL